MSHCDITIIVQTISFFVYHNNNIIVDNNACLYSSTFKNTKVEQDPDKHTLYSKMQLNFMVASNIVILPISFWQLLWHLFNIAQAYLSCHKLQLRYGEVRGGTHVVPPLLSQSYM